jgi:hypothetical protein
VGLPHHVTHPLHTLNSYRGKLLDDTETHLVHSAENAKAVASKAKEQYRQGSWNLCHTCIILLSVGVIFMGMIVAIRVSEQCGGAGVRGGAVAHTRRCLLTSITQVSAFVGIKGS